MKTKILASLLFVGGSLFAYQLNVGIRIGPPPRPRVVRVQPVRPGADYVFVDGYWYASGSRYRWHDGYWTRPPYGGATWVAPRHDGERYYDGYWDGEKGHVNHDHRWDRNHDRDYRRDH